MLNVVGLSVAIYLLSWLNVIMPSELMLSVIMLNIVMLSVVMPF
jgi:hypothetical protein